jgi:hypothetical protein
MLLTKKVYRTIFLEALRQNGLTVYFNKNNFFILIKGNDSSRIVAIEFVTSTRVKQEIHSSPNGNILSGIGRFKFTIPKWENKINFYVFAFLNTPNREIEYVIVSDEVLRARLKNRNHFPEKGEKAELTLWMMQDKKVYDTEDLSIEGEWYLLSPGSGGRMADGTDMDYTEYLNNLKSLNDSLIE